MIQGYYVEVCDMILSLGHMLVNSHLKHLKIKVRSKKKMQEENSEAEME